MQRADLNSSENRTFLQIIRYPSLEGKTVKKGLQRASAHTDESLITLLHPLPGAICFCA